MKNELVEYLSDLIESCGYSLPTVEIEAHAREIIDIVIRAYFPNIKDRNVKLKELILHGSNSVPVLIAEITALFPSQGVCVDCFYIDGGAAYCYFHDNFLSFPKKQGCSEFRPKKSPLKASKAGKANKEK